MASFLDLLDIPSIQAATAQTRVVQQRNRLAVTPRPALADIFRADLQRRRAMQDLSLGAGRLQLAREAQRAERRQFPFAVGLGVAGLGVGVLGGIRGLQAAGQEEARQARIETRAEAGLQLQRDVSTRSLDLLRQQQARAAGAFLPLDESERLFRAEGP